MSIAFAPKPLYQEKIRAGVHPADGSIRPQVVTQEDAPHLYQLLKYLKGKTGSGIVLNTSFNRAEPIVHWPEDALNTLYYLEGVEYLAISNFLVRKGSYKPSIIAASEEPKIREAYRNFRETGNPDQLVTCLLSYSLLPHQLRFIIAEHYILPMFKEAFDKKVLASVIKHIQQKYSLTNNSRIVIYPQDAAYIAIMSELINDIMKELRP